MYWVVNVGGFLGPPLAGFLHRLAWKWVFVSCALIVSLNFLVLLTYEDAGPRGEGSAAKVFLESISKLWKRPRALVFVLVMSLFFVFFMQLYDALPNFIEASGPRRRPPCQASARRTRSRSQTA